MSASLLLDLPSLRAAYAAGRLTPSALVEEIDRRSRDYGDPALWLHRLSRHEMLAHAHRLEGIDPATLPLYGVPFAIKDNIDLAGSPTTAACPAFGYMPSESAPVVAHLLAAGGIPVGKTNLDQFATGLVGTRSPHGTPRNPVAPELIPGGSSSGSACAVAAGLVSFALGTDTAGSGRVPAALQELVGFKPTRGWLSTRGVVPACRSLDCVSIFAHTIADAWSVATVAGGYDAAEPFSRRVPPAMSAEVPTGPFRFAVPRPDQLEWFGDTCSADAYARALATLTAAGGTAVPIDFAPFAEAARLLYEGPWVAERWSAVRAFVRRHPDALWPLTARIIEAGATPSAVDAFEASYRLAGLQRAAEEVWASVDSLVLPTIPTVYTPAEIDADPLRLNTRLGTYTNFANLLDTAAWAVPSARRDDGRPFGITFFGPAWSDARLATLAARFRRCLGAEAECVRPSAGAPASDIVLAVAGAHLRGQPLNPQLVAAGGRYLRTTTTSDAYHLYALTGTTPPKPALVRTKPGVGAAIEVELWALPAAGFGRFVADVPAPLGIGTVELGDRSLVKGFICESLSLADAVPITHHRGWRAYLAAQPGAANATSPLVPNVTV